MDHTKMAINDFYSDSGDGELKELQTYKEAPMHPFLLVLCERDLRHLAAHVGAGCQRGEALDDCVDAIEAHKSGATFVELFRHYVAQAVSDQENQPAEAARIEFEKDGLLYLARARYG